MNPKVHVPPQFPGAVHPGTSAPSRPSGSRWIGPVWLPLAAIWTLVLHVRHKLYDWGILHSERGALPTLVVGNVELGGTGKTPHVLDLTQRLQTMLGEDTVGVLTRGYGRASAGFQWVSEAQQWQDVGDEPWMMQRRLPSLHVAVCEDRLHGLAQMASERPQLRMVVLDDGMQHRALRPDLLVGLKARNAPSTPWQWTKMVPAGTFRDLPSRLERCDLVVDTSGAGKGHHLKSSIRSSAPHNTSHDTLSTPVLLVTGIARPERATQSALDMGIELAGCAHYPDHHAFQASDVTHWIEWLNAQNISALLTTEKDAVRLQGMLPAEWEHALWVLPSSVHWEDEAALQGHLESWVQALPSLEQRMD